MKKLKWLVILLTSTIAFGGCAEETVQEETIVELQEAKINAEQKTEVKRGDMQLALYYDAQVGPKVEQLSFPKGGTFGEFCVQLGDTVKEGDILATPAMDNIEKQIENKREELASLTRNYEYRKATLENDLAIVNIELERVLKMLETQQYLSAGYTQTCMQAGNYDEQRQKLELQLKQLQETYDLEFPHYKKQLQELVDESEGNIIRAPFDGTIVALSDSEYGHGINTDMYYVAVADTSVTYARCANMSTSTLNKVQKMLFWMDGKEYEASYIPMDNDYYIETQNNVEDAYATFEITDPNGEITLGDYGKVKLITQEIKDVLYLPETAVRYFGGNYYVYKDVDGRREQVPVRIGGKDGINIEIVDGLEEGDVVYVQE